MKFKHLLEKLELEKDLQSLDDYDFIVAKKDLKLNKNAISALQKARETLPSNFNFIIKETYPSGFTVNISLMEDNKELDMGGIQNNEKDELTYYNRGEDQSKEALKIRDNRFLLRSALIANGFENNDNVWYYWFFNIKLANPQNLNHQMSLPHQLNQN